MTTPKPPMLSFTKVSTYLDCPMKYKFQYEDKAPRTTNIHFVLGDAIHKALELNDNHFIKHKKHLPPSRIVTKFNTVFKKAGKGVDTQKNLDATRVIGEAMIKAYIQEIKKRVDYMPAVLEQEFSIMLETIPVQFRGFIDQIMEDGSIRDRKTSKTEYQVLQDLEGNPIVNPDTGNHIFNGDRNKKLQLIMYAMWYRKTYGKKEKILQYDVITKHKRGPRVQLLDIIVTDTEFKEAEQLLGEVSQKIINKEFPALVGRSCEWCEFKKKCPAQSGGDHALIFT